MRTATDSIEQDRFTTSWSVQYLITALSYHISRNEVPRLWKSSDKDHLMRQCRDTAFVQLLGLAPVSWLMRLRMEFLARIGESLWLFILGVTCILNVLFN